MQRIVLASVAVAAALAAACADRGAAAELDVRLRFGWRSGAQPPQLWVGSISAANATLTDLQPLGIEADEAAALQLVDNQVLIEPLAPRAFDGCDVSIRGDEASVVTIRLQKSASAEAKEVRMPLNRLAAEPLRTPLDDLGGYLLIGRTPGDALRVRLDRDHLVFAPGESIHLKIEPNLVGMAANAGDVLEARLTRVAGGAKVWESSQAIDLAAKTPLVLDLTAPAAEDAYRLTLGLSRPAAGITTKLNPFQRPALLATRDVEFVVVDPDARLPHLAETWELVQTVDLAQEKWWQQMPPWTQLDRLPVLTAPRTLGNVKPVIRAGAAGQLVELPALGAGAEPAWRAYPLEIPELGRQYVVEIDLPPDAPQQLAASLVEPDAADRVQKFGCEAGVFIDPAPIRRDAASHGPVVHRFTFWPRTTKPILLLANQSPTLPAQYGEIRILRRQIAEPAGGDLRTASRRTAVYISEPRLAASLGGAEQADPASGLSIQGWGTFLDGARRLAQELRAGGFNTAIVGIAADGGSLAGVPDLSISPRHDSGLLSSSGADVVRKDVLELLLRVFDREGLQLVPAIELAAPLPKLETLRRGGDSHVTGVETIGADGRTWSEHHPGQAVGARYNLLSPEVQAAVGDGVAQLVARYGQHPSLAGVALQLPGHGFGVLPGLSWSMDDATAARFTADTQVTLAATGTDRFTKRAKDLNGPERARWTEWRRANVTRFYVDLAARVAAGGNDRQLVLCTENMFGGAEASAALRQAVSGRGSLSDAAAALGVDLEALAAAPGVCLLRPRSVASNLDLGARALELQVNSASEFEDAVADQPAAGELTFHVARPLRLATFDAQSPFGADKTLYSAMVPGFPAGAEARRTAVVALGERDFYTLVEGADILPRTSDPECVRLRRIFQQLPGRGADLRTERCQPVTMRVFRTGDATSVCVINESPWAAEAQIPLESTTPVAWQELGASAAATDATGTLPSGANSWKLPLPPYSVVARRFASRSIRVGHCAVTPSDAARAELAARIQEIDQRMQGLDVQRAYAHLDNPGFELPGPGKLPLGWEPRIGAAGSVAADATVAAAGAASLHLASLDTPGVAAQSQLFPIPATGQLTVRVRLRTTELAAGSQVFAWAEYDLDQGIARAYREFKVPGAAGQWTTSEVTFDDLPLGGGGQMRVHLQMYGPGEAWIDDVELFDLKFADSQKIDFVRRLSAAKIHLDEGKVVDCQRLLEGYWPRYLVQYLPASGPPTLGPMDGAAPPDIRVAAQPESPAPSDPGSGLGDRMRKLVPKTLR